MAYRGGNCDFSCDTSYEGCKVYPELDESYNTQSDQSFMFGVAPRTSFGPGMTVEGDDDDNNTSSSGIKIQAI
ncbi:hypothetical protein MKW92_027610 [Papaver armeniacum]|nr:hypothetical protein MKW92_027610 [Papaver armeniacum]